MWCLEYRAIVTFVDVCGKKFLQGNKTHRGFTCRIVRFYEDVYSVYILGSLSLSEYFGQNAKVADTQGPVSI